ncbi:MAG: hypothetical protein LBV74_13145 [Tannerella sp.]|nr:hypothetical protein [Tannerella sp.]
MVTENGAEPVPEEVPQNPFVEMYGAVKRAILTVRANPAEPESEPFFRTVMIDNGQFARILREENTETEIAFPAVFVHFINVRYLVQQQRIGQGRATMRIRFILNNLNNRDPERECDPFIVFQWLNTAIQDAKSYEPALNERCNLTYFDMPLTTNMLQAYWIDYEVWFRETSSWKYRNWVERYVVMPPFTNHSDAPEKDENGHGNHLRPDYNEVTGLEASVGGNDEEISGHT